jgi:4-carboxymuconolactone decarboxylase
MKIFKISEVAKQPFVSLGPLFTGPVTIQNIIGPEVSNNFFISQVNFERGVRNKFHIHDTEQILIVTEGKGIVATDKKKIVVSAGDIVHIPAGEKHWHGATKDTTFSHLYVMTPETKTTQLED